MKSYEIELTDSVRQIVSELVSRGKGHLRKSCAEIIELGKVLIQLKEVMPFGSFSRLVQDEFALSDSTAQNMMNAAKRFADNPKMLEQITPTILYQISAPSCPFEVIDEVFTKVSVGENVTLDDVKKMRSKFRFKKKDIDNFFDDLESAEARELQKMELELKKKLESLIETAERTENEIKEYYKKIHFDRVRFSERVSGIFKIKAVGENAKRVLEALANPDKWNENFGL